METCPVFNNESGGSRSAFDHQETGERTRKAERQAVLLPRLHHS